LKFFM